MLCWYVKTAVIWWGDPHIQTQDGLNYTFNGLGEYWMLMSDSLQLQARTERAWNSTRQPSTSGTVFAAVTGRALYEESNTTASSARVHVEMPSDRTAGNSPYSTRPRPLVAVAAVHYPGSVYRCRASRGQSTVKCSALL